MATLINTEESAVMSANTSTLATTQCIAWAEIPVTDLDRAITFYGAVTGRELILENDGPNPMAQFAFEPGVGVGGHLYPGKPSGDGTGPTVHLGVESVEEAAERLEAAGGTLLGPIVTIPVGRFQYALDLDGNSLGLFQRTA